MGGTPGTNSDFRGVGVKRRRGGHVQDIEQTAVIGCVEKITRVDPRCGIKIHLLRDLNPPPGFRRRGPSPSRILAAPAARTHLAGCAVGVGLQLIYFPLGKVPLAAVGALHEEHVGAAGADDNAAALGDAILVGLEFCGRG